MTTALPASVSALVLHQRTIALQINFASSGFTMNEYSPRRTQRDRNATNGKKIFNRKGRRRRKEDGRSMLHPYESSFLFCVLCIAIHDNFRGLRKFS
jgi:hypothetical protein